MECYSWLSHIVFDSVSFLVQFFFCFPGVGNCLLFSLYLLLSHPQILWLVCKSCNSFSFHLLGSLSPETVLWLQPDWLPTNTVITVHCTTDVLGALNTFSWGFLFPLSWVPCFLDLTSSSLVTP